ncbi:hypothetical protein BDQ17DRAFT_1542857 [Cyathus striatus]|nr:hypothetical protein BDQ17DRAFT_1542857 [Cyathus striatus]
MPSQPQPTTHNLLLLHPFQVPTAGHSTSSGASYAAEAHAAFLKSVHPKELGNGALAAPGGTDDEGEFTSGEEERGILKNMGCNTGSQLSKALKRKPDPLIDLTIDERPSKVTCLARDKDKGFDWLESEISEIINKLRELDMKMQEILLEI